MKLVSSSATRVSDHTADHVNQRIHQKMEESVAHYAAHPELIQGRLEELDREWDIERTLQANAATLALTGTILGATVDKRFLIIPGIVTAFLLQHAVQGWCPPLPVFRRLGIRTQNEIEQERYALKALRGDFKGVRTGGDPETQAVRKAMAATES